MSITCRERITSGGKGEQARFENADEEKGTRALELARKPGRVKKAFDKNEKVREGDGQSKKTP